MGKKLPVLPFDRKRYFKLLYLTVMCDFKNHHITELLIRPGKTVSMLLVFFAIFFFSCDEVKHHETLSFFFDGVPPLQPEMYPEGLVDPNSLSPDQAGQKPAWYAHEPSRDCSNCHSKRKQRSFSTQIRLIAPIPKLCYNCHDDYTTSATFVHGPVAVGQCIFCHNPHRSKIEHLLTAPEPGLCYLCHDINTIELITAHLSENLSTCTNCHNPHASSIKGLLKSNLPRTIDEFGRPNMAVATPQENIQIAKEPNGQSDTIPETAAPAPVHKSQSLSEVFRETSRLIELGQLQQARAYLEKFKDSDSFTAEQRQQVARVLGMIDSVINNKQQPETGKDNDQKIKEIADLYYSSMAFYRTGQFIRARNGFVKILNSGLIPESMAKTIRVYIADIDKSLAENETSTESKQ
jgi:predicted CXXCH cytochrome family protein